MRRQAGVLTTIFFTGAAILAISQVARAQYAPPANQQPMEIPAQYPQQRQYPPQGGPGQYPQQQGAPQQQGPNDPGAARVSYISGDISTQPSGSTEWVAATVNSPVVTGDQVSTGNQSRAEIELDHANILRMSDQSAVNISNLSRSQIQVQVGSGLVTYDVLKGNEADIEIQTPNVSIRPQVGEGSYRVLVNSDGETIVDIRGGSAEISTPQGTTHVDKNQRITIQGNADNAQYQISNAPGKDDWDKWNGDRDHAITSAQSWQHTNPNYTGSQDLDAYGQWNNVPDYGDVWFPSSDSDWAPYRDGRWVYEPYYGWTWVSYEPWGWAPYHYGRWFVYGGRWGWWLGPVYSGYYPVWAPAYVSFFGFGGGGWGVGIGFGFGGSFGSIGWLPCGPGDQFFPWYGRGVNRVNVVNAYNVRNNVGGFAPLRTGPRAFSNVDRAFTDDRVRAGVSSMQSGQFGRARVPSQQQRFDSASLRSASVMTGASPVSPSRESFRSSDRQVSPGAIPNRAVTSQRFFSASRQGAGAQSGFNRGGNPAAQSGRSVPGNGQPQSGGGWRTFSGPAQGSQSPRWQPTPGTRTYEAQGAPQSRTNTYNPPARSNNTSNGSGYSRPPLNMQQPIVTPRQNPYPAPATRSAPSGGESRGGSPSGYPGGYSGGGNRGGSSGGGSRSSGSSSGGHGDSGHNRH